jgi:hypothetical protein
VRKKALIDSYIASGFYDAAHAEALSISAEYARLVLEACLKQEIERIVRNSHTTFLPATPENLFVAINEKRDREARELMRRGARVQWEYRHWQLLIKNMFGSSQMQLTINYMVDNHLLPVDDLDAEYFFASVCTVNTRLTQYLSKCPRIEAELLLLSDERKEACQAQFTYWKCRNLVDIVHQLNQLYGLDADIAFSNWDDGSFIDIVRTAGLLSCCVDSYLLHIRDTVLRPRNLSAFQTDLINQIKELVALYPDAATGDMLALAGRLRDRYHVNAFPIEPLATSWMFSSALRSLATAC